MEISPEHGEREGRCIRFNGIKLAASSTVSEEHGGVEPFLEDEDAAEVDAVVVSVAEDVGWGRGRRRRTVGGREGCCWCGLSKWMVGRRGGVAEWGNAVFAGIDTI